MFIIFIYALAKTTLGRYLYGVGGNEEASRLSGIGVTKIKLMAYGLSGFLAGIAGLVLLSRTSSGQPSAGSGYEMDAITAVVLGGVSLNGGEGKLHMVVIGMLIMGVLTTGMIMCGINDYVQQFVKGIVLILAVAYSEISKKIRSVKRDKQRKGQFIGGKPMYGYKMHPTEKNKIVIDEEVAPVVRRIFAMALDGMSCRKIAATLNEEGVPTPATYCGWNMGRKGPYAGLWSSERISEMLQNETYLGNMVQGRTVKISYKSKKCLKQDRENWVVVENTHEPLIDKETFQKVRMLVNSRKHTRSRTYDFLLKGLIFCHECGYPMAVLNRPPVSGEDRLFFVCRTYQRFTKAGVCSCHSIKEQVVTEAVLAKSEKSVKPILIQISFSQLLPMQ